MRQLFGAVLITFLMMPLMCGGQALMNNRKKTDAAFGIANKMLMRAILVDCIIIGLVLMAMARDKVESEKLFYLRVSAAISAFSFGVILVVLRAVIDTIYKDDKVFSAGEFVLSGYCCFTILCCLF